MPRRLRYAFAVACLGAVAVGPALGRAGDDLPADRGASGTWQKLLKLRTTASAMHTTAHPDDEHGGVLAWISRGQGARLSLLTLNRGEAGDNAIGPELFDGLGLVRTEELGQADRYYGVDDQYFTPVVDYGFSKRLDEALEKWGKDYVLGEMVRVVRVDRPLVLIARFQGSSRDGHGNHMAAGLVTREAFHAAGDPAMFPEQAAEGLRPWQPLKLYMGGVRENEDWTVRIDAGQYCPWLGTSYSDFARIGLSFQRSQNGGQLNLSPGSSFLYYRRLASTVASPDKEKSFFDGLDTRLSGLFALLKRPAPGGAEEALRAIERHVEDATGAFTVADPSASVPALARGLEATRAALRLVAAEPEVAFVLRIKERQFMEAIHAGLGLELTALAQPADTPEPTGPFAAFAPPPTFPGPVPGQSFEVVVRLANRGGMEIAPSEVTIEADPGWKVTPTPDSRPAVLGGNAVATRRFAVTLADGVGLSSRPHYSRSSLSVNRYEAGDAAQRSRPVSPPPAVAVARYSVAGTPVEVRETVRRREARLPYGYALRELRVVPPVAVNLTPSTAVVPAGASRLLPLRVELIGNVDGALEGTVALELPPGWTARPPAHAFRFSRPGERRQHAFEVTAPATAGRTYEVRAVATAAGRQYREGYEVVEHRDLETRYLYRPARSEVRGVDVKIVPGLSVGYVMGVGDQVPAGIAQLGARVQLLGDEDLATGDLGRFDAIVTGTRAYVVREDLNTYNQRLLDYVKAGGNLIVLYNTPEFVPARLAPFPAELPRSAEEVSEEDSPVEILAPGHPVLRQPNAITRADFDGWVEQRGSKFFSAWDPAYTALVATHDKGQEPQKGGWVTARYGKGYYTYFAYALHRQLPYGVPGAYRLLANLLSLGREAGPRGRDRVTY